MKTRVSLAILGVVLLMVAGAAAQDNCMQMTATAPLDFPLPFGPWAGPATVTFGDITLQGNVEITSVKAPDPKGNTGNAASGAELATFTFPEGDSFQVLSHFQLEHMTSTDGVYHINDAGKIVSGTGLFEGVSGATTSHGAFWLDLSAGKMAANLAMKGPICWKTTN